MRCEDIATQVRYRMDLRAYSPLPAFDLAEHLDIEVCAPREIEGASEESIRHLEVAENWSAIVMVPPPNPSILYNPSHALTRRESDVMHEIAHLLLNHSLSTILWIDGIPQRTHEPVKETEAAYLGGTLLIPRRAIWWCQQQGLELEKIANQYGGSIDLARWRINSA